MIRAYHKAIKNNHLNHIFSDQIQIAFSKAFSVLNLEPPSIHWKAESPKPQPIAIFENYPENLVIENDRRCWLCFADPDLNRPREWVAHTSNGESHPLHKSCAVNMYLVRTDSTECSSCRGLLNRASLIPLLSLTGRVGLFLLQSRLCKIFQILGSFEGMKTA